MGKKSLSQYFLINLKKIDQILQAFPTSPCATLLEIGPGQGALTHFLAKRPFARFIVVEKEEALALKLKNAYPNLEVYAEDILHFSWKKLKATSIQVVGNLPYHLTQEILFQIGKNRAFIQEGLFMIQKEAVEKLREKKTWLGAYLQMIGSFTPLFSVAKTSFSPQPKVDSKVFRLSFPSSYPIEDSTFLPFLKALYHTKRKTLFRSLKLLYPDKEISYLFTELSLAPNIRIDAVSSPALFLLYRRLQKKLIYPH